MDVTPSIKLKAHMDLKVLTPALTTHPFEDVNYRIIDAQKIRSRKVV